MGHYLSALAFLGNHTGNRAVLERSEYLVRELHTVQKALGGGYLSAFPEEHFERLRDLQPVWAPFYVARPAWAPWLSRWQASERMCTVPARLPATARSCARTQARHCPATAAQQGSAEWGVC